MTTSTLGFGLGYDERIMSAIARGGSGNEHFAEEPDTAAALIAGEVEGLLAQTAQAASLHVRLAPVVRGVLVVNDLPANPVDDGLLIELGSFYAEETRKLVLTFDVPAVAALGLTEVATLDLHLRGAAGAGPAHGDGAGPRQRGARRPGRRPRTRSGGAHRAGLPARSAGEAARLQSAQQR